LSAFRNIHQGVQNFDLESCVSTSKEKPNTTNQPLELRIVQSLTTRPCW